MVITEYNITKSFDKKTGKWRTTQTFELKWKLLKARYPHYDFVLI